MCAGSGIKFGSKCAKCGGAGAIQRVYMCEVCDFSGRITKAMYNAFAAYSFVKQNSDSVFITSTHNHITALAQYYELRKTFKQFDQRMMCKFKDTGSMVYITYWASDQEEYGSVAFTGLKWGFADSACIALASILSNVWPHNFNDVDTALVETTQHAPKENWAWPRK